MFEIKIYSQENKRIFEFNDIKKSIINTNIKIIKTKVMNKLN
jgi:hypothetical protein